MKPVTIFLTLFLVLSLFRDFNRDKGEHQKAKVFHFILSLLLVFFFSGVLSYFLAVFGRFDEVRALHEIPIGILPVQLNLWSFVANTLLCVALVLIVFRMALRNEKARKLLNIVLPCVVITQTINFYQGFVGGGPIGDMSHGMILLVGFVIMAGIAAIILAVYNSAFMKAFFQPHTPSEQDGDLGET